MENFECKECGKIYSDKISLSKHINSKHCEKMYYDKWIKSENENFCQICNKETIFRSLKLGYRKRCEDHCPGPKITISENICVICNVKFNGANSSKKYCSKKCSETGRSASISAKNVKQWKNKDSLDKMRNSLLKKWEDPLHREKCSWYNRKVFLLPSGKEVSLQGFEPEVLEMLLEKYYESDICIESSEIRKETGRITYFLDDRERSYFPDFFIKSTNTIIEVKSSWTYRIGKSTLELKRDACLARGFNFELIIPR